MTLKQKLLLAGVILIAIFFRFYLLNQMPGGLFPDEAANGLDINLMQQGHLQPFYERGNGREALFFYMLWGSVELFGKNPWAHHAVSALIGVLSVLVTFFLARRLARFALPDRSEHHAMWIGLISSFIMATSSWHIVLSRTAFRAIQIPLFASLTLLSLIAIAQAKTTKAKYWWSVAAGGFFALGFYTYIAFRIMAPLIMILVLWPLLVDIIKPSERFSQIKKYFLPLLLSIAVFILVIAPIGYYFYSHPGSFIGRSGQVSVFNPELNQGDLIGTIGQVSWLSLKSYFTEGDLNWRHNISGQPFLSIIISPLFLFGLILTTLRAVRYTILPHRYPRDWTFFLLAGWFFAMLVPVVTTAEGIPHGLRSIGTIPAVFIMTAFGFYWIGYAASHITNKFWMYISPWKQHLLIFLKYTLIASFVASLFIQSYALYFIEAANSPENFYAFRSDLTTVSNYLNEHGSKQNTYLVLDKFSIQTVDYMTSVDGKHPDNERNQPYQQVDPENVWELQNLNPQNEIVFTQSSIFDIRKFKQFHPNSYLSFEVRNKFGQTEMAVYQIQQQ